MHEELAGLLDRMSRGETQALGLVYDLMSTQIYNYVLSITRNRQISEDITHDIFLQILKYSARIRKMSNPYGYILTMARNLVYSRLKREGRVIAAGDALPEIAAPENGENMLAFREAFKLLPANQREVIYLHLICGFTQKETAKIQQAPLVTVKWRYRKALATLRKEMEG
jgi:RNA polymerase sigma-70 factor (ECF subfamily)